MSEIGNYLLGILKSSGVYPTCYFTLLLSDDPKVEQSVIKCLVCKSLCLYFLACYCFLRGCKAVFPPAISITRCSSSLPESVELKSASPDGPGLGYASLFIRKQTSNLCPAPPSVTNASLFPPSHLVFACQKEETEKLHAF